MSILYDAEKKFAALNVHSPLYLKTKTNPYGGGDIGDIYQLIDVASSAGFSVIEFLPIQDTGYSPSPYMGISVFSYNPIHLSLKEIEKTERIIELERARIRQVGSEEKESIDYKQLYLFKCAIFEELYKSSDKAKSIKIDRFSREELAYALFSVLRKKYETKWIHWPEEYKQANIDKILQSHKELEAQVKTILFAQATLKNQWQEVALYGKRKGVEIALEKPIYPIFDSAEVWANQELFYLNDNGSLRYESGCNNPRDPFGPQRWGHAVYQFKEKPRETTEYFLKSIKFLSIFSKIIKLDHTLALIWKYFIIDTKTGRGKRVSPLGEKLFNALRKNFPDIFFIAEDVGYINEKMIDEPLKKFSVAGMRCLHWTNRLKYTQIHKYPRLTVAVTSYANTLSLPAWLRAITKKEKKIFLSQIKDKKDRKKGIWSYIELIFKSNAILASVSLRDLVFDLRRYNHAGMKNFRNWKFRSPLYLEKTDFSKISTIISFSGRK